MTLPVISKPPLMLVAAAVLSLAPACEASAVPTTHTVVIDKMKFGPVPKNVRAGDSILWVNKDIFKHTATARDKSFGVHLPPKSKGKTVIKRSGTIPFYCIFHPGMKGVLQVRK